MLPSTPAAAPDLLQAVLDKTGIPGFTPPEVAAGPRRSSGASPKKTAPRRAVPASVAHRDGSPFIVRSHRRCDRGSGDAVLDDSTRLEGDLVVWACGPWLGRLFPELVSLSVTRQELLFFDGGPAWRSPGLPGWCDYDRARYGTADIDALGVKAAIDDLGAPLDPDAELSDEAATEPQVRAYLHDRFPALEHAHLIEARSCRYELTPDTHFIAAPHPEHPTVWLVGGGSGHGFKQGPPMAERLAQTFREGTLLPPASRSASDNHRPACARRAPARRPEFKTCQLPHRPAGATSGNQWRRSVLANLRANRNRNSCK